MRHAWLAGIGLLLALPAGAQAQQKPAACELLVFHAFTPAKLATVDHSCWYTTTPVGGGMVRVLTAGNLPGVPHLRTTPDAKPSPSTPPAPPPPSPELLELMRMQIASRQAEIDRLERMQRDRDNRELGMFMLRQAFRPPVYIPPPPPQLTPQERHMQYLLQEYLENELARQRRERWLP